jgi:hypothetical protein
MSADRDPYASGGLVRVSVDQRQVSFSYASIFELLLQDLVRQIRLGNDQRPGCVLIQAVNDARPCGITYLANRGKMVK